MSAQLTYSFASKQGIAGGLYDLTPHAVDSFRTDDVILFGIGLVQGATPGETVAAPTSGATADKFEGIALNSHTQELDMENKVLVKKGSSVSVLRYGRAWVRVEAEAEIAYGDALYLVTDGDEAGFFTNSTGSAEEKVAVPGKFLASANDQGLAPVELFNAPATVSEGADLSAYQKKITVSGILKGDGQGGVSAADAGTDYSTVKKLSDLEDVEDTDSPTDGKVLKAASQKWKPGEDSGSEAV